MTANKALAGQRITAAWLNTNIPGNWAPITPSGGWANQGGSSVNFQARLRDSVTVEVVGTLSGGTITGGTTIGTLPAGMRPITTQIANGTVANPSGEIGDNFEIAVFSSGAIQIWGVPTGSTEIGFHFLVSLDA